VEILCLPFPLRGEAGGWKGERRGGERERGREREREKETKKRTRMDMEVSVHRYGRKGTYTSVLWPRRDPHTHTHTIKHIEYYVFIPHPPQVFSMWGQMRGMCMLSVAILLFFPLMSLQRKTLCRMPST